MLSVPLLLTAQEFRSTVSGSIADPSGAAVPNAKIQAREKNTGARYETVSGSTGDYSLPFLPPGPYTLAVESGGFKKYLQDGINVTANQRLTIDITLQLGEQVESVTVTADAAMLQSATASVGQSIGASQIASLPMNGRTPLTLAQLSFGITPSSDPRFTRPFDNAGPSGFSMGGGQGQSNELLLDGAPDMTRNRRVAYNPPVDAVQEIKVEAFQPDAAYGSTAGGTVNVVLKGGTNDLHGSLYEFHQNQRLKATPFFTNAASQSKPVTRFNQYGGTVGGPILLPGIVNGRDRLFFFFGSEGIRQSEPEPTFSTVPTAAQRAGNFSQLLSVGPSYQLYDPTTGVREGSRIRRQPFANNVIPNARLNPVAQNFLQFLPQPNVSGGPADGTDNFFSNAVRSDVFSSFLGRIDAAISQRHKLFLSGRYNDRVENRGNRFDNIATGNNLLRQNWGVTLDDVYTFTPTFILNTRLNWTRFVEGSIRPSDGFDFTSLGLPASLRAASAKNVLPLVDFSNFTDIGNSGGDQTPFDSYQIFLAATKIHGSHTLKFGTDLRTQRESSNGFGNSSGAFNFAQNWLRGPLDNSPNAPLGQDLGAFLLGVPTGGRFDINATRTQSNKYASFFVQDDWRVSNRLSFNFGVRYEKETGTIERHDRAVRGFDSAANLAVTNAARAAYAANPSLLLPVNQFNPVGGILFADPDNRRIFETPSNVFSPRFGFSWRPPVFGSKTVLRGGAGVFYQTFGTFGIQQPGFSQSSQLVATLDNFLTPAATLSNPFPNGVQQPSGAAAGVNTFLGQSVRFVQRELDQPYTVRWNFNIQRELASNLLLEAGYIGSVARRLPVDREVNFIPASFLSTSPVRDQANIDRLTAVVANPFAGLLPGTGLNGGTVSIEQLLRPHPQFSGTGGLREDAQTLGYSNFHMLQVRLDRRFSNGLQFLTNFQWSKMQEATNYLFESAPNLNRRIAGEDRPLRFVFSSTYELPFGRGKHFAVGVGPWMDRVIGGWQLSGIYTAQSGPAVTFGNSIFSGGNLEWDNRNVGRVFNTSLFETNAGRQLNRNQRTFPEVFSAYRVDMINNLDLSVIKDIPIVERIKLQFRAESFNAFNRASFNGPNTDPVNRNFGVITSTANLPRTFQLALRLTF
jgi:hypothetical protein